MLMISGVQSTLAPEAAPKRGQYDRSLSRQQRQANQKERLIAAVAAGYAQQGARLTVADVVSVARVGRNSFYEYFDDVEHALQVIRDRFAIECRLRLAHASSEHATPLSVLRAVLDTWLELIETSRHQSAVVLDRVNVGDTLTPATLPLLHVMTELVRRGRHAAVFTNESRGVLTIIGGLAQTVALARLQGELGAPDSRRILYDAARRLLR